MRLAPLFLALAVSTTASAATIVQPGSSPQLAPANTPFPNQIAVQITDANGVPAANTIVGFLLPFFDGPVLDGDTRAYDCFPDLGWNCRTTTDSNGIAILPGLYSTHASEFNVSVAGVTLHFSSTPSTYPPFKSLLDMWWSGPAENGWGMSIIEHGAQLFNVVYAYDANGDPTWWAMPAGSWAVGYQSYLTSFSGSVYAPRSSPYFAYDPKRFVPGDPAGTMTLGFDGHDAATLTGTFDGASVTKRIQRMDITPDRPDSGHAVSDMWWGGEANAGFGVSIIERGGAVFAVWLTYGADGKPTWLVMPGGKWAADDKTLSGSLYRTRGSAWAGAAYDASKFAIAASGTYTFHFADPRHATLDYSIDGHSGSVALVRQPF
ncbi:MAG: hypothetical protein ACXWG3_06300 [Usitatibacter sp.]